MCANYNFQIASFVAFCSTMRKSLTPKFLTLKLETKFDDFLLHDPDFFSKTVFGLHYVYRIYRYITRFVNQYAENIELPLELPLPIRETRT